MLPTQAAPRHAGWAILPSPNLPTLSSMSLSSIKQDTDFGYGNSRNLLPQNCKLSSTCTQQQAEAAFLPGDMSGV